MAKKYTKNTGVKQNSSKLVRVGNCIYPAVKLDNSWWTDWPDGSLRTCSPDQILDSFINDKGEWIIKPSCV